MLRSIPRLIPFKSLPTSSSFSLYFATTKRIMNPFRRNRIPIKTIIQRQIKEQNSSINEGTDFRVFLQSNNWTLTSNQLLKEITRTMGDKTITVVFLSRTPPHADEYVDDKSQIKEGSPALDFEFSVYVRKDQSGEALCADYFVQQGETLLGRVGHLSDFQSHKLLRKYSRPNTCYLGPLMGNMPPGLYKQLGRYFLQMGINEQLVRFIQMYSVTSEHELYVKWLQQLQLYS